MLEVDLCCVMVSRFYFRKGRFRFYLYSFFPYFLPPFLSWTFRSLLPPPERENPTVVILPICQESDHAAMFTMTGLACRTCANFNDHEVGKTANGRLGPPPSQLGR